MYGDCRILADFRRRGTVRSSLSWRRFLATHIDSLFAMDFLAVDTVCGHRFYVLVIIAHKTRRVVHHAVTRYPNTTFLRQQLIHLRETVDGPIRLLHDNDPVFRFFPYDAYDITGVCNAIQAPNMNAYVERFIGSLRRETLDWFVIFGERQLKKILSSYIAYYNTRRPHQGINQNVPNGYTPQTDGTVVARPVLFGLHHHYERRAAEVIVRQMDDLVRVPGNRWGRETGRLVGRVRFRDIPMRIDPGCVVACALVSPNHPLIYASSSLFLSSYPSDGVLDPHGVPQRRTRQASHSFFLAPHQRSRRCTASLGAARLLQ